VCVPELRGIEMPQLLRIKLPEQETEALSRVQRHLDELAQYARTFTAAAEMLSFSHQKGQAHEAQYEGDRSALGIERRNLLAEWQAIAVREGAMTLLHYAAVMNSIAADLLECPTLADSIDQARLRSISAQFKQIFPGFRADGPVANTQSTLPPSSAPPGQIRFSQNYSADQVRIHGEKNNVFRIGESRRYIARAAGSEDLLSYSLDSTSVYELREITAAYAEAFSDLTNKLSPRWAPEAG
jgi:hypothetical protein